MTGVALSFESIDSVAAHVGAAVERVRRHPFVRDALAGELSRAQTVRWVLCAGRDSRAFVDVLSDAVSWIAIPAVVAVLRGNLEDELGNGDPERAHFRHYLHLLDRIGVARAAFEAYREGAGVRLAVEAARAVSRTRNTALALGYLVVNESMTPVAFEAAKTIVRTHFPGVPAHFFDAHIAVDEWHVAELYRALACLQDDDVPAIRYGVDLGERGMAALLDEALGIYEHSPAAGELIAPS